MCSYEYSMYDLICDVISSSVRSCSIGKINVYDKIVMKNKKKVNTFKSQKFVHKSLSKTSFLEWNLQLAKASAGSADTIYGM